MPYCCVNLAGPQTLLVNDVSKYKIAKATMAECYVAAMVHFVVFLLINIRENEWSDRIDEKLPTEIENPVFTDLIDLRTWTFVTPFSIEIWS